MSAYLKFLTLTLGFGAFMISCTSSSYPISDHFNGKNFYNPWTEGAINKSFFDLIKWQLTETEEEWPQWLPETAQPQLASSVKQGEVHLTLINHASYLMQFSGFNIITDPVFSERVSPVSWLGPNRRRPPGIAFENLPPINYVIISHNHYDHMDLPSLQSLAEKHNPLFIVPLGNKSILHSAGVTNVIELDWWQSHEILPNHLIHLVPVQHWSARGIFDRNKALWGGYVVDVDRLKVYFGGDTGYGPHFKETFQRFGAMDVSLLPIGAYEPRWFMKEAHMNPEEAVQAHIDLGSQRSLGMHYGTFQLTNEGIERPVEALELSLRNASIESSRFIASRNGQTTSLTGRSQASEPSNDSIKAMP